jgi:hypothetical protein
MARSKALAMRDYMRKPAEQSTKRITPEPVVSSSQETESRSPATYNPFPLWTIDTPKHIERQMEEYGLTREGMRASYRKSLAEEPEPEPGPEPDPEEKDSDSALSEPEPELEREEVEDHGLNGDPVRWEPTCPNEDRDFFKDASQLGLLHKHLAFEETFIVPFAHNSRQMTLHMLVWPAIQASCDALKADLEAFLQGDMTDRSAVTAKALVFYRRHSPQLAPHLTTSEIDAYEGMCNFLICVFRNAGYPVHGSSHQ